ncbi:membrane protein insertase YidC [Draconibacterium halophilum]|uniref:Membrane protein insertase YidC n=1 Tax=Draconibacterium halophilum TaxID=2706887 RepID=A0A6C0RJC0_9BACT|nr:membrane protein insertase YidC [Draconibacterium halophilum]QIA09715.1 membrane protein insertase YidC [Draconibacterium halophilum]
MDSILSPFIYIIRTIYEACYSLTGNYGVSILLLSFAVSLLLLPIFVYIEKAKKRDDAIKRRMQPLVNEIKQVYTGQERYYYLKTLNRQFGYSQFKSLVPILSLLVQIPFFIAAYQYLDNLEAIQGVSFGPLADLSEPDHLFGFVNVLPILMTLVNLLTVWFYTRNGNTSERIQMTVVAGVFLVLLYNLPSGLVLYWTMNNVFAFLRLFITNREVFSRKNVPDSIEANKKPDQKEWYYIFRTKLKKELSLNWQSYLSITIISFIILQLFYTTIISEQLHVVSKIVGRTIAALIISFIASTLSIYYSAIKNGIEKTPTAVILSALFVSLYLYLASLFNYNGVNEDLAIMSLVLSVILQIICVIKTKLLSEIKFKYFFQFILLICLVIQAFHFLSLENTHILELLNFGNSKTNSKMQDVALWGLLFVFIILPFTFRSKAKTKLNPGFISFFLSVLFVSGFVLIWNPLVTFSTFPEAFQFGAKSIINSGLILMPQIILGLLFLYWLLPKSVRFYFSVISVMLVFISVIHSSIIPINVGTLQGLNYSRSSEIDTPYLEYLLEAFANVGLFFLVRLLFRKYKIRHLNILLIILNLIVIGQALYAIQSKDLHRINEGDRIVSLSKNIDISDHNITLSKDKENVVVIMLDMIEGWYFQRYLDENPKTKTIFDGFTYYPNTVSSTNYTGGSMPGLIGGYDFAPLVLDEDKEHTLREKMTMAGEQLRDKSQENGYFYTCSDLPYCKIDKGTYDRYIPIWSDNWSPLKKVLNIGQSRNIGVEILRYNALFFSSPLLFKPVIYDNGSWHMQQKGMNEQNDITRHYNSLRALPYITDNRASKKTFTFMSYKATHFPWDIIAEDGSFVQNVDPYTNNKWGLDIVSNWLKVLKAIDTYDNTRIIIASDHGLRHAKDTAAVMINHPYKNINYDKVPWADMLNFSSLLLVKDFSSTGEITTDSTLMSTLDVQNISFNGNSPLMIDSIDNRTLDAVKVSWEIKMNENKVYPILRQYEINQNIFDINNWTRIK